jgi:hypothetical protein
MATAKVPTKQAAVRTPLDDVAAKLGTTVKSLHSTKVAALTNAARAKLLGISAGGLVLVPRPIVLSPAKPLVGTSSLTLFTSLMVYPLWPANVGEALFSSRYPGAVDQGAQVAFMRIKKGHTHLVEFHVTLNMNVPYQFRVFTYPLGDFVDVTIQGPKTTVIAALAPPVDQISGPLELGASIQQRNSVQDDAGWSLQTVEINAIG